MSSVILSFNPRPCARGDFLRAKRTSWKRWFQSTPLREGRPTTSSAKRRKRRFQSTPLREGRLHGQGVGELTGCVSIHAPARGATRYILHSYGDQFVSIHAPARGATRITLPAMTTMKSFNPRPCARGDQDPDLKAYLVTLFQSTPLREGRQLLCTILS